MYPADHRPQHQQLHQQHGHHLTQHHSHHGDEKEEEHLRNISQIRRGWRWHN
jgi:hypothetical protein